MTLVRMSNNHWFPYRNSDWEVPAYQPASNIIEAQDHFRIEVMVPGFDKKDIKVQVENMLLTISAEWKDQEDVSDERMMRKEFSKRGFSRSFRLSHWVDGEHIEAKYSQGILSVRIPKKEEALTKPGREIKVG